MFPCLVLPAWSVSQTVLHFSDPVCEGQARAEVLFSLLQELWRMVLSVFAASWGSVTDLGRECVLFSTDDAQSRVLRPTFCVCGDFKFQQCFLNCNMHMNHSEILLKCRFCFCRCSLRNYLHAVIWSSVVQSHCRGDTTDPIWNSQLNLKPRPRSKRRAVE